MSQNLDCFVGFFVIWLVLAAIVEAMTPASVKQSTSIIHRTESFLFYSGMILAIAGLVIVFAVNHGR